ncbi:MAG: hypothetical protein KGL25_09520 [Gammaproteobacteria bacterium]|nr:hypothetical protein [Gammaproteobacteria bacterium]
MNGVTFEEIKLQALGLTARELAQLANTLLASVEHLYELVSDSDEAGKAPDEATRLAQKPSPGQ